MFIKTVFPSQLGHNEVRLWKDADTILNSGFYGYWFNPSLDFTIPSSEMKDLMQEKHIVPMGMELPVEFREGEEVFLRGLKNLKEIASYAEEIGIRRSATWIVPASQDLSYISNFSLHLERLGTILDVLADHGITLGLEYQSPPSLRVGKKYHFINSLDEVFSLISALKRENCGVIMDSWHWYLSGADDSDFDQFESGNKIVAVHINDAPKGLSIMEYQDLSRQLPCSTGIIDIARFLKGIERTGYAGPLLAEPFDDNLKNLSLSQALGVTMASIDEAFEHRRRND